MTAYHQPDRLDEALALMASERLTVAAGCTDLFAATEAPALGAPVLDITRIADLRGVERDATGWRLGAATTWAQIVAARLPPAFDMLKLAAREVGSVQIQNAGTLAGNLCNASPAADGVPPLLALDAEVELADAQGRRRLPLTEFLTGPGGTARRPDELVVAVHVPAVAGHGISTFRKLGARRHLVISIAMVAVRIVAVDGAITDAAIAVGACSPVAVRLRALEAALVGRTLVGAEDRVRPELVVPALAPISDVRGDAAFRGHAATELVGRALAELATCDPR